jgi:hypothetical protein
MFVPWRAFLDNVQYLEKMLLRKQDIRGKLKVAILKYCTSERSIYLSSSYIIAVPQKLENHKLYVKKSKRQDLLHIRLSTLKR